MLRLGARCRASSAATIEVHPPEDHKQSRRGFGDIACKLEGRQRVVAYRVAVINNAQEKNLPLPSCAPSDKPFRFFPTAVLDQSRSFCTSVNVCPISPGKPLTWIAAENTVP